MTLQPAVRARGMVTTFFPNELTGDVEADLAAFNALKALAKPDPPPASPADRPTRPDPNPDDSTGGGPVGHTRMNP